MVEIIAGNVDIVSSVFTCQIFVKEEYPLTPSSFYFT